MTRITNLLAQIACVLATSVLVAACGGGDAEPPPKPSSDNPPTTAPAPDTTAPTVSIFDDTSAPTATGPVTFSFVFSEDVGASFAASDVAVTGGTSGAFTKVSGTQWTLVVTPTANTAGTINISVGAATFSDLAGNGNTAGATAQQAFDTAGAAGGNCGTTTPTCAPTTVIPAGSTVIYSDAASVAGLDPFPVWGQSPPVVGSEPTIAGNKVLKYTFGALYQGLDWSGTPQNVSTKTTLHLDFFSNDITSVKVSIISAGNKENAVTKTVTPGSWNAVDIDLALYTVPDKTAIIQIKLEPNVAGTLFVDNIYFHGTAGGGAGGGTTTTIISFDETPEPKLTDFGVNGAPPVIVADPVGGTNKVLKIFKYQLPAPGSEQWAGVTVSTGANDSIPRIPFTATDKTMTLRVYSPAVGVRVRLKVEDATNNGISCETDAITTKAGVWETLTFNFANPGTSPPVGGGATPPLDITKNYTKASIFMDFGIGNGGSAPLPADRVYYADDLSFVGAPAAGGGGGTPVVFSSGFGTTTTVQAGAYGGYSGSSVDNFSCGAPASCGSGGSFSPTVAADVSEYYYYYQTPVAVTSLYAGIFVQAPGLTTGLSSSGDTAGVSINGKTTMKFNFGQNPEWFSSPTKNFGVILTLGKYYNVGTASAPAACNIKLLAVVTPTAQAVTAYSIPISSFGLIQTCNVAGLTPASALALGPLSQVDFQAVGSGNPLPPVNGQSVGANMSVPTGSPAVYPTTLVVKGGISFE